MDPKIWQGSKSAIIDSAEQGGIDKTPAVYGRNAGDCHHGGARLADALAQIRVKSAVDTNLQTRLTDLTPTRDGLIISI